MSPAPARSRHRPPRALRGVSGVLAGGLVALALVLLAGWLVTTRTGSPGPGTGILIGHGLAAVVAVAAQLVADRRSGRPGALAALAVVSISAAVLAVYWLV
ncbi:hypothetical protein HF519_18905 [Pseudonocardia bannensis]|uniref:Uncharacterized protein n=1 Tax=Pseudonocardia bannensis TaxID=630973 RepID=A0A848DLI1_9PSEU|nr:hypothetical protein [Pseudonocardia bannensis]NMH93607.1 hypothetical protein [Pseudonocardia bannensis]